jgi:cell wall assembly regulator SMI1
MSWRYHDGELGPQTRHCTYSSAETTWDQMQLRSTDPIDVCRVRRMTREQLENRLRAILKNLAAQGFDARELVFAPPASERDVRALESELGMPIPASFREVLTEVSEHVEFRWFAPDGLDFPFPFTSNFCGDLHWSLGLLRNFEADRQGFVDACVPDPDNDYVRVWHDKLAFQRVGNGDLIAIDLRPDNAGKVVYLSHDDDEGHGRVLAPSFRDLIDRWVPLACSGGEDWQWMKFLGEDGTGLDPAGDNALAWRTLLNIGIEPPPN